MAKHPATPNNPFAKLLELGLEHSKPASPRPLKKTGQRKAKSEGAAPKKPAPNSVAKASTKKKGKKAKKGGSAPGFKTTLPNVRNLTAAGTKKHPPYQRNKPKKTLGSKRPQTPKRAQTLKPQPVAIRVDEMIEALPRRTMQELQKQWLNCLRWLKEDGTEKQKAARQARDAILAEWERRSKIALSNPDYFDWPSTQAGPGDRSQRFETWNQQGVLKYMGYEVGITKGLADHSRHEILDAVYSAVLPPVNSPDYVKKWGLPATASRLQRLANELARFARNGKRNLTANYTAAVGDWEADLKYLHRKYYIGKFNFGWPSLRIG